MKYVAFLLVLVGTLIMALNGLGVLGGIVALVGGYLCGRIKN